MVHSDLINGFLVNNSLGGFKRIQSKHTGAPLMLQVVLMIFSMIDSVSGMLIGKANQQIDTIKRRDITHHSISERANRKGNHTT